MQLLRKILFPFSLIYATVIYVRNWLFDVGFLTSESYKTPTVCVGNLSAGGTGKTPMVETLVSLFKDTDKIAVLSRGYGRKSKGYIKASSNSSVEELGDEPYQIWSKYPEITMVVDVDRQNGIKNLEIEEKPNLIILDDGYQHRKVKAGFSILLTAYGDLYVDDWYLPTGNLRDSKKEARRANIIVVTKCPSDLSKEEQNKIVKKLAVNNNQKVLFAFLGYNEILKGNSTISALDSLQNKEVTLVTGIANPKPLEAYLKINKVSFQHLKYADHHFFTDAEIARLKTKSTIITTEKDFVRLKDTLSNLAYIEVSHCFLNQGKDVLLSELENYMSKNS